MTISPTKLGHILARSLRALIQLKLVLHVPLRDRFTVLWKCRPINHKFGLIAILAPAAGMDRYVMSPSHRNASRASPAVVRPFDVDAEHSLISQWLLKLSGCSEAL